MKSKNIHLLPTDKPSKLLKNIQYNTFWLSTEFLHREVKRGVEELEYQNIYITNDEEIKEGDWVMEFQKGDNIGEVHFINSQYVIARNIQKKIILTDNEDLIKDGVRSIDDEFLKWFVKNPSCEEAEVNKLCYGALSGFADAGYRIIIPTEEPKKIFDLPTATNLGSALTKTMKSVSQHEGGIKQGEIKKMKSKNIHILPTDKPSRLLKSDFKITLLDIPSNEWKKPNINIYITNDEEIKEGDWFICQNGFEKKCVGTTIINNEVYLLDYLENTDRLIWCKKIILTTDQDLIRDGVQAIDDEFLEWFIKNPSCEYVDLIGLRKEKGYEFLGYEIIIPKEELTFENSIDNTMNIMSIANSMFGKKEEPKQETLEEASSRCAIQENKSSLYELGMKYFQLGAKWQSERMYSEEDIIDLIQFLSMNKEFNEYSSVSKETARYFLEQFKKK